MNQPPTEPAWYRQFWPWVLIALPGTVVIASFITLYIAIVNSHSMVKDDYYKDGLAINRYLKEDQLAEKLAITAELQFLPASGKIKLQLLGEHDNDSQVLILYFIHPVNASADFQLPLQINSPGDYEQSVLELDLTRWYLQLSPADASPDQRWRIRGEINLASTSETTLASSSLD
jgi:hypothetical protein